MELQSEQDEIRVLLSEPPIPTRTYLNSIICMQILVDSIRYRESLTPGTNLGTYPAPRDRRRPLHPPPRKLEPATSALPRINPVLLCPHHPQNPTLVSYRRRIQIGTSRIPMAKTNMAMMMTMETTLGCPVYRI
jgi:hypothetical protein